MQPIRQRAKQIAKKCFVALNKKILKKNSDYAEIKSVNVDKKYSASVFRQYQNQYLKKIVSDLTDIKSVLNIGAISEDSDKQGQRYSEYWSGSDVEFFTLDKNRSSAAKTHFQCDLHNLNSLNNVAFDLILCMSTLEHVENPQQVLEEIRNISNPGGYLYIVVPWFYPLHKDSEGRYGDYWRFNDDALRLLLKSWDEVWIKAMPSVITAVEDRDMYWRDVNLTSTGYCGLFKNKN